MVPALILPALFAVATHADTIIYNDPGEFFAATGTKITDNYTNTLYMDEQTDAYMSGVLGETKYHTTTWPNNDIVFAPSPVYGRTQYGRAYCGGCNGGFVLDFTSTSIGSSAGVYGVGFWVFQNDQKVPAYDLISYADGTTDLFPMPRGLPAGYWGITSDKLISEMQIVDPNGHVPPHSEFAFAIQALTIAAAPVPEPGSCVLLLTGLISLARYSWRKAASRSFK
jgi:hypothetical protein